MRPLAAIYHPGRGDPNGYPVVVVDFTATWSEETGTITEVVVVATDGSIRTVEADRVQIVDRAVAEAVVAASEAIGQQRQQPGNLPPRG